jgi:FkbM family methyltransferase
MREFLRRVRQGYRVRQLKAWYHRTFSKTARAYTVRYNEITGPYRLVMRLADGPGMPGRLHKGTEMPQRRIFLPLLRPGWHCCDVGAHVGDYTVEMALLVGSQGSVHAYEPVPHYFGLLQKTIAANGLTNVVPRLAAVGAAPGIVNVPVEMLGGNLARPRQIGITSEPLASAAMAAVAVIRLDDELEQLDALKVDCEGYEVAVLKGMERLVRNNQGLIVLLEVHDTGLQDVGSSLSELGAMLVDEYRLKIYQIGSRHCICTRVEGPFDRFPQRRTRDEFVAHFRGA